MGSENYEEGKCNRCLGNSVDLCRYLDDWVSNEPCNAKNNYANFEEYDGRYPKYCELDYDHSKMEWESCNKFETTVYNGETKIRNCCPVCGSEFEIEDIQNVETFDCKSCGDSMGKGLTTNELITDIDDYAWCL